MQHQGAEALGIGGVCIADGLGAQQARKGFGPSGLILGDDDELWHRMGAIGVALPFRTPD